jgi:hypothetical protein
MTQLELVRRALVLVGACTSKSRMFLRMVEKDGFEAAYIHAVTASYSRLTFTKRSTVPWSPIDVLNVIGNLFSQAEARHAEVSGFWHDAYVVQNYNSQYVLKRYPAARLLRLAEKAIKLSKEE